MLSLGQDLLFAVSGGRQKPPNAYLTPVCRQISNQQCLPYPDLEPMWSRSCVLQPRRDKYRTVPSKDDGNSW